MNTRMYFAALTAALTACNVVVHPGDTTTHASGDERGDASDSGSTGGGDDPSTDGDSTGSDATDGATGTTGTIDASSSSGSDTGPLDSSSGEACPPTGLYEPHYTCDGECFGSCADDGYPLCVTTGDGMQLSFCSPQCETSAECPATGLPAPWDAAECVYLRCIIPCTQGCPDGYQCTDIAGVGHCLPPPV